MRMALIICLLAMWLPSSAALAAQAVKTPDAGVYRVVSPDGRLTAAITVKDGLTYAVNFQGRPLLLDSPFSLYFRDAPAFGKGLIVREQTRQAIRTSWENRLGKRRQVVDRCNELRLHLQESAETGRKLDFVLRAYDSGIALRYAFPANSGWSRFTLTREETQFRFAGDPTVWAADYGGYASSQEGEFRKRKMSMLRHEAPYGTPLTIQANPSAYVAITEADLQDWAGMYLSNALPTSSGVPLFESGVMRGGEAAKHLDVSLTGKQTLRLVIGDSGDNFNYDHSDWADAKLTTRDGKVVPLSSLQPIDAQQGFGTLGIDRSVDGHPLKIGDRAFSRGLGSHSKGEIVYELDGRYTRLEAEVGIDAEVGMRGTATFSVYATDAANTAVSGLVTRLAPRHDGQGLVQATAPHKSPWRVLLIGARPGDLVESDLILNLSEPCAIDDPSWVQPGKCAWDHWWSGDVKMDTATEKEYIRFAAEMGFPYQLIETQCKVSDFHRIPMASPSVDGMI